MQSLCQWATSISKCDVRLSDRMWLLWAWLRWSERPCFHEQLKKHNGKECLLRKGGGGVFHLKRYHNYFFQVRKQLFTVTNRKQCECVVCAISPHKEPQIVIECIYPDLKHRHNVAWSFLKGIYPPRDCGSLLHKEMYLAHEQSQWQWGMLLSGSTLHWGCYWNQG